KLSGARVSQRAHVGLGPKFQTPRRTGFDARRLEPLSDAIRTERALVDLLRGAVELRDVERAPRHAVLAADAVLLLEVDDAVRVLNDGAVGGARAQAAGILAVHALVLAHEPHQRPVVARLFVELDQVPVIPGRRRHRL